MMLCGFDLGGTKSEVVVISTTSEAGVEVLFRERMPTDRDKGYEHILSVVTELWQRVLKFSMGKVQSVGFGLPGSVDPSSWMMLNGNTQALVGKDLKHDFKKILGQTPFIFENDANCFAYAEVFSGVGRKFEQIKAIPTKKQIAVGIILGTGCGSGIVYEGQILQGSRGGAGEFGHSFLREDERVCYCGRKGCAELFLSGKGLEEISERKTGSKLSAEKIFSKAEAGSNVELALIDQYKKDLAFFLSNICSALNPHYFVLGGGLSNQSQIYQDLEAKIEDLNFLKKIKVPVYKHSLGDSAGVIGAALRSAKQ